MWDVFICHAYEDKDEIARPLAEKLNELGIKVWYDEYSLKLGDSLRRSIDKGLTGSNFGVVILSHNFFSKEWPQKELDALYIRDTHKKVILPIWHKVNEEDLSTYSLTLASKFGVKTSEGLDKVIKSILEIIYPEADFFVSKGDVIKISPSKINLTAEEWAVETNFTVKNMSNHPLHDIALVITFEGSHISSDDVEFELIEKTNIAKGNIGSVEIDGELLGLTMINSEGNEFKEYHLYQLGPQEQKTIRVKSKKSFKTGNFINLLVSNFEVGAGKIFII
ncbi:toll/interleukin-1 receptor domain-containing protein [Methanobacterium aggregans]|uniref:toll/interleukin-1 receptor domain-containing protein n=1 Tax=Methanobacterium aggregans TaxID=1615586 RepID=UPI001AE111A4|nr:toll/interleukin-1 receptor domain-containing protein [Methanobacterium aggregans]MBP2045192.1 hypothetical protein [Methanobacterium aggregans]